MCKFCEMYKDERGQEKFDPLHEEEDLIIQIGPETPILRKRGGNRSLQIWFDEKLYDLPILTYCPVCGKKIGISNNENFGINLSQYSEDDKEIIKAIRKYRFDKESGKEVSKMDILRLIQYTYSGIEITKANAIYEEFNKKFESKELY